VSINLSLSLKFISRIVQFVTSGFRVIFFFIVQFSVFSPNSTSVNLAFSLLRIDLRLSTKNVQNICSLFLSYNWLLPQPWLDKWFLQKWTRTPTKRNFYLFFLRLKKLLQCTSKHSWFHSANRFESGSRIPLQKRELSRKSSHFIPFVLMIWEPIRHLSHNNYMHDRSFRPVVFVRSTQNVATMHIKALVVSLNELISKCL